MNPDDNWRKVRGLVQDALDLSASDLPAFLASACDSEDLRRKVESLLAAERAAGDFLELPAWGEAWEGGTSPRVGCYRLLRELGRGGMSTVYLARRDDDVFDKRVAIKVLRADGQKDNLLRRFHNERRILANLDHPHIARLLDGGRTANGRPYFVMEYVEGEPIDVYCDRRHLETEERIKLFRRVCAAVQYAHQNLVIHRDLKPSNVLVTGDGTPKLLDFGIAKLLDPHPADGMRIDSTQTWHRVLTPQYASPEQVRGEAITTTSDVYSLGVMLYALLSGRLPYRFESRTAVEIERLICEQEPPWPSSGGGDLDHIVMKALRKEPASRYPTVDQMTADLRRFLDRSPVAARQGNRLYHAGKFLRRHRLGVAVAAAFSLVLIGFAATTAMQSRRIAEERDRARQERNSAVLERQRSEQVSDFLVELFELSDPGKALGRSISARELLDRGAARIQDELRDQPRLQADLMRTMGGVYDGLGLYDEADNLLRQALESQRRTFGSEHLEVARTLYDLAGVQLSKGAHETAEELSREALNLRRVLLPAEHPELARTLTQLGSVHRLQGDYEAAERLLRDALRMLRMVPDGEREDVATGLHALAYVLFLRGDYEESEDHYRQALTLSREIFGDGHPRMAPILNDFALLLARIRRFEEASEIQRATLEIYDRHFGDEHPDAVTLENNLAGTLVELGRYQEAERLAQSSLALNRKLRGEDHFTSASTLLTLARIRFLRGELDEAESHYRRSFEVVRRQLGDRHPHSGHPLLWLGRVELARGRPSKAEPFLRQALEIWRATLPEGHLFLARVEGALGVCHAARGEDAPQARALLETSHRRLAAEIGEEAEFTRWVRGHLDRLHP